MSGLYESLNSLSANICELVKDSQISLWISLCCLPETQRWVLMIMFREPDLHSALRIWLLGGTRRRPIVCFCFNLKMEKRRGFSWVWDGWFGMDGLGWMGHRSADPQCGWAYSSFNQNGLNALQAVWTWRLSIIIPLNYRWSYLAFVIINSPSVTIGGCSERANIVCSFKWAMLCSPELPGPLHGSRSMPIHLFILNRHIIRKFSILFRSLYNFLAVFLYSIFP